MSSRTLFRIAAVALGVSGVALALGLILHPLPPYSESVASSRWAASHLLWWVGAVAAIAGLAGLYLRVYEQVGILGFVGSLLAVVALAGIAGAMYFEAFIAPSVAGRAPELFEAFPAGGGWEGFLEGVLASGALFGVGFLALGVKLFGVGRFPGWAVVLAVLGGIPFAVNFLLPRPVAIVAVAVFGVGLLGLAHALWKSVERPVPAPRTERVRGAENVR